MVIGLLLEKSYLLKHQLKKMSIEFSTNLIKMVMMPYLLMNFVMVSLLIKINKKIQFRLLEITSHSVAFLPMNSGTKSTMLLLKLIKMGISKSQEMNLTTSSLLTELTKMLMPNLLRLMPMVTNKSKFGSSATLLTKSNQLLQSQHQLYLLPLFLN
jgi:hypothetical protein